MNRGIFRWGYFVFVTLTDHNKIPSLVVLLQELLHSYKEDLQFTYVLIMLLSKFLIVTSLCHTNILLWWSVLVAYIFTHMCDLPVPQVGPSYPIKQVQA